MLLWWAAGHRVFAGSRIAAPPSVGCTNKVLNAKYLLRNTKLRKAMHDLCMTYVSEASTIALTGTACLMTESSERV